MANVSPNRIPNGRSRRKTFIYASNDIWPTCVCQKQVPEAWTANHIITYSCNCTNSIHYDVIKGQRRAPFMFLCYKSEETVEQTFDWPVVQDTMTVIWRRRNVHKIYVMSLFVKTPCTNATVRNLLLCRINLSANEFIIGFNEMLRPFRHPANVQFNDDASLDRLHWMIFRSQWRHEMESFSALLTLCAGNSPVAGEFPAQRPVTRSFHIFFDLRRINNWVNDEGASELRRHRAHYDVNIMWNSDAILLFPFERMLLKLVTWTQCPRFWPYVLGILRLTQLLWMDLQHNGPVKQSFGDFFIVSLGDVLNKKSNDQ